jgi:hypothetical protein
MTFLSLKNYVNVASKKNKQENLVTDENSRIRSQRYGFADPDPYQNVTDPQNWIQFSNNIRTFKSDVGEKN